MAARRVFTKRDCPHGGLHAHGTARAYRADRCRCTPCVDADRRNTKLRRMRNNNGTPSTVPADAARRHVRALQAQGMGVRTIAARAGVARTTVGWLIWPRTDTGRVTARLTIDNARKILAVRLQMADEAIIDGTGTQRRIKALVAMGWSFTAIAREMGYDGHSAQVRVHQMVRSGVRVRSARAVAAVYDRLWNTPPPANTPAEKSAITRSLKLAQTNGWVGPLCWDDSTIDDPTAKPWRASWAEIHEAPRDLDEIAISEVMSGRRVVLTKAERAEAVRRLNSQGFSADEIARRVGVTKRTAVRRRAAERQAA